MEEVLAGFTVDFQLFASINSINHQFIREVGVLYNDASIAILASIAFGLGPKTINH
jgi:ABC-type Mn2+/Zn2+ transport system permease subunit